MSTSAAAAAVLNEDKRYSDPCSGSGPVHGLPIWISNWATAQNATFLRQHHIRVVVCVVDEDQTTADRQLYEDLGIERHVFVLHENEMEEIGGIFAAWQQTHEVLKRARRTGRPALVHCLWGVNRSVSAVMYHLMLSEMGTTTVSEALELIRHVRPQADPMARYLRLLQAVQDDQQQ